MVNLMNIYKMDLSSGVFVDLKSSTMHDWLKTFQSLVLALLIFLSKSNLSTDSVGRTSKLHTHSTSLINTVAVSNKHENVLRKKHYSDSQNDKKE